MFIEIEKSFELSKEDHNIIAQKLTLKIQEKIYDIYKDTLDYKLNQNGILFRSRNNKNELKVKVGNISSEEYYGSNAIDKLKELGIQDTDLKDVYKVSTEREKYQGEYQGNKYEIHIDKHKHGKKYEIEVFSENEAIGNKLIDDIIRYLGLEGRKQNIAKRVLHIKEQNPKLYKIISKDYE